MRIAQVSGHFPPNFVSGGTLVPQRLAQAVAEEGLESFVFAGYLGSDRAPLESWTETTSEGIQVTWVATTPWTGWSDSRNYDNPEAVAVFRRWLEQVRPDVVHFHSIQTLGAGMIPAAAEVARVVVTMHDFWWFCARQFLVDRQMTPCAVVTQCGVCECEAGVAEREFRSAFLTNQLAHADVILAPSSIARDVFIANGVDPDRVAVDENGLPAEQLAGLNSTRSAGEGDVRLLFAGSGQPMKGADVLADALRTLGEIGGVSLDVVDPQPAQLVGMPSWVHARDRYNPRELGDVLAQYDVLLLPSVMRESHSILTREALAAGLAVVCTDTLGPEEAVRHEYNGLVVPAADAASLAEAIARLAANPDFARTLMGKGSVSPIRQLSDQIASNIRLYRALATPPGVPAISHSGEVLEKAQRELITDVLFVTGIQGAPLRYRVHLPAEALRGMGIPSRVLHYRSPELPEAALTAAAVVFYRVPATSQVLEIMGQIRARRPFVPVLFDIDDLIFDPSLRGTVSGLEGMSPEDEQLWWRGVARYRTTMEECDGFVGSTNSLTEHASALTDIPSYRFANGVGELLARRSDEEHRRPRRPGPLRIGYFSGTTMHDADWAHVEDAVIKVLERHHEVELHLGGHLKPTARLQRFGDRIVRIPFVPWLDLPAVLRDTDICLAPLSDGNEFNEAKSAIKWLEAALVGTPTIASPTEPFREAIDHGVTGLLAQDAGEWVASLELLLGSAAERARMGAAARRSALLRWSPSIQARTYRDILVQAALHLKEHGRRESHGWERVVDDEPLSAALSHVEEYGVAGVAAARPKALRRLRRVGEILAHEGITGLTERARRKLATRRSLARRG